MNTLPSGRELAAEGASVAAAHADAENGFGQSKRKSTFCVTSKKDQTARL